MEPEEGHLQGAVLHEALHSLEIYEAMHRYREHTVHYATLLAGLRATSRQKQANIHSVLDLGCGVGFGVKALWSLKYTASGVDISPTAISTARQRYEDPKDKLHPQCLLHKCFQVGSAKVIPFPGRICDAIMSAGLLEHIEPRDVNQVIAEMARVTRQWMFIEVASQSTLPSLAHVRVPSKGNQTGSSLLVRSYRGRGPAPLERTIRPQVFWVNAFERHGFVLERNLPLSGWNTCCAFVLRRNASSPRVPSRKLKASVSPGLRIG